MQTNNCLICGVPGALTPVAGGFVHVACLATNWHALLQANIEAQCKLGANRPEEAVDVLAKAVPCLISGKWLS